MGSQGSIFISAGDPSADFPGQNLISELTALCPGLELFGFGGPMMQQAGLTPLADHKQMAVLGFWEIVPRARFFYRLLNRAASEIRTRRPKAIILLDYPGFNLRLAAKVKPLGIPIIYYISPQVWAWGKRRLSTIRKLVDRMLVIFPFEESFFRNHGINATFVGHPLVDRFAMFPDKPACRATLNISNDQILIALLPGSREQEVSRMLPVMMQASELIKSRIPKAAFIVAGVDNIDAAFYGRILGDRTLPVRWGQSPEIMNGSDFVIAASGTATVETAYFGTPMVIIYKTGWLTYQIAKRLVDLEFIGMVNLIAGRQVVPELIQNDAGAETIAAAVVEILTDEGRHRRMVDDLAEVRASLGTGGAGRRAAETIREAAALC
jgi:lipid-A-disaccharide synthase